MEDREVLIWVPFWFESNQSFGACNNKGEWDERKADYLDYWKDNGGLDLSKAMIVTEGSIIDIKAKIKSGAIRPNFGFRMEHTGEYSLADFAKDNKMNL